MQSRQIFLNEPAAVNRLAKRRARNKVARASRKINRR